MDPANYFPVLNLSLLDKVNEKMAAKQLQEFLVDELVFDPFQTSFCSRYGMVTLKDDLCRQWDHDGSALLSLFIIQDG